MAALAMCLLTQILLRGSIQLSPFSWFIFSSTLFLYAIHRIVGLKKVNDFIDHGRYLVIATFKSHIIVYAILAGLASIYLFFQLSFTIQLFLVIPALVSLAYVLPLLYQGKRLRDIGMLKIFLIAIVWAIVTVLLPAIEMNIPFSHYNCTLAFGTRFIRFCHYHSL